MRSENAGRAAAVIRKVSGMALATALFAGAVAACAPALSAQPPVPVAPAAPPQIHTSATEEVEIAPDRATISIAVETRAKTAAGAGAENARIQTVVLDTLRKMGIDRAQIRTQGVSLAPEYEYPRDGGRPTAIGYQARNTIQVEVRQLPQAGPVVDAALAKGATNIDGLRFFASNVSDARREALGKAVAVAKADAEALARAAGGTLGAMLELTASSNDGGQPYPTPQFMMAKSERADAATPIEAGQLKVSASVSVRWAFVPR